VITTGMTWLWIAVFAGMTASSLVPPLVDGAATVQDSDQVLSVVCYWVVPFTLTGLGGLASALCRPRGAARRARLRRIPGIPATWNGSPPRWPYAASPDSRASPGRQRDRHFAGCGGPARGGSRGRPRTRRSRRRTSLRPDRWLREPHRPDCGVVDRRGAGAPGRPRRGSRYHLGRGRRGLHGRDRRLERLGAGHGTAAPRRPRTSTPGTGTSGPWSTSRWTGSGTGTASLRWTPPTPPSPTTRSAARTSNARGCASRVSTVGVADRPASSEP
jgi:hypothetical protein